MKHLQQVLFPGDCKRHLEQFFAQKDKKFWEDRIITPNPLTSQNSLLDISLHSRKKKSSSTHQNTDTSFPNQKTLTSH